jgi:cyclase
MRVVVTRVLPGLVLGLAGLSYAQQAQNLDNVQEHILPVQGNIYMMVGAGGNTTLSVGKDGVLIVDTQFAPLVPKMLAEIKKLSDKPIRYIINTHVHGDHTGGNEALSKAGSIIVGGNFEQQVGDNAAASIIAHENVLTRMSGPQPNNAPALPFAMLPTDTYLSGSKEVFFNGEAIQVLHQPNAHTDGDSIVFFRRSDVVAAGDIFTPGRFPGIDLDRGGSINGLINGLNRIIEITIPADKQEGGTYVIPGHGRLCDEADVVEYRDMATIVRDRVLDLIKKGMTLAQVKDAKPTLDYDPLYGQAKGATDRFVEQVYKSLSGKK